MKRQRISKRLKDAERMVVATQRLEALLRNPGPGITVTPVDDSDDDDDDALSEAASAGQPQDAIAPTAPPQQPTEAAPAVAHPTPAPGAANSAARAAAAQRLQQVLRNRAAAASPPAPAQPSTPGPVYAAQFTEALASESATPAPHTAPPLRRAGDAQTDTARPGAPTPAPDATSAPSVPPAPSATAAPLATAAATAPAATTVQPSPSVQPTAATVAPKPTPTATPDSDDEPRLAAPNAPRVATLRDAGEASGTRPRVAKKTSDSAAPAKAQAAPRVVPRPAPGQPSNAGAGQAAPAAPSAPAAPRARVDSVRASGFTGFLIDWLLPGNGDLKTAVAQSAPAFGATGLFSFVINILMLAGPLFMLQVYDRVMTSGSIPTLVALFAITAGLYAVIGVLELVRSRIVVRIGVEVDQRLSERIFRASLRRTLATPGQALPALRELDNVRQFVASQGPITFFDAPWTPIYLVVIFLVHWILGVAALLGGALLVMLAWMSESRSRGPILEAGKASARSLELADTGQRNAEAITAMGMLSAYIARWQRANGEAIAWQTLASDRLGGIAAVSKAARLLLQSLMLAIGAWLAVKGDISAGSIIAGTIIFGRALAPVEQGITHWRGFLKARESYLKLDDLLTREPVPPQKTALPAPKGHLAVTALRVAAPDTRQLILANLAFRVEPGQMLAVIGPSASGKSTLARTIVGLWPAFSGQIDLDGARLDQWDQEALGRHIGYLPQNVELFSGSVRDNISRFRDDATDEQVMAAARMAHAHEMILALPQGYDTELGNFGTYLSAGQRQRIGLARALFGNPALIVLDEPNANLDRSGDEALSSAVDGCRARGQAILLVSHRVQAIGKADLLLYLDRGVQRAFGPRAEVMKLLQGPAPQAQPKSPGSTA